MYDVLLQIDAVLAKAKNLRARPRYDDFLMQACVPGRVVVITGMRRTGKSSIALRLVPTKKTFYFSAELDPERSVRTATDLESVYQSFLGKRGKPDFIVLDEVQDILEWERFVRARQAEGTSRIVVTGSNARLLSSELATYLSGRYVDMAVHPLSLKEWLDFSGKSYGLESVKEFLVYGSLPEVTLAGGGSSVKEGFLRAIKDSLLFRDIVQRHGVKEHAAFARVVEFLADNTGQFTTARRLHGFLQEQGGAPALSTITNFLLFCQQAFVVLRARRYDVKGRRIMETNNKFYFSDLGVRNAVLGHFSTRDIGQLFENAVYGELVAHGWDVCTGDLPHGEIDFVARRGEKTIFVQAAYLLESDKTYAREIAPLRESADASRRLIVTLDPLRRGHDVGVDIIGFDELEALIV